jgi:hypothetical protein
VRYYRPAVTVVRRVDYYRAVGYQNPTAYYEHIADTLPVGSRIWFDQMQQEGRFGGHGAGGN